MGINGDPEKQQAAEAFINFISRPDNVVRNMDYIGYTSVIAGGDSDLIFSYADWCYDGRGRGDRGYPVGFSSVVTIQIRIILSLRMHSRRTGSFMLSIHLRTCWNEPWLCSILTGRTMTKLTRCG